MSLNTTWSTVNKSSENNRSAAPHTVYTCTVFKDPCDINYNIYQLPVILVEL